MWGSFAIGFLSGIGIGVAYFSPDHLETLAKEAEIVTAVSVLFAAFSYRLQVKQNELEQDQRHKEAVADQIHLFRTDILGQNETLGNKLMKTYPTPGDPRRILRPIPFIDEFSIDWISKNRPKEYAEQKTSFLIPAKSPQEIDTQNELFVLATSVLNAIEELCVRILLHQTLEHEGEEDELVAIKIALVQVIEQLALPMLIMGRADPKMYQVLKKVYRAWYKDPDTAKRWVDFPQLP